MSHKETADQNTIRKHVMAYACMVIGESLGYANSNKILRYRDPQTFELRAIKIDGRYIHSVEEKLGLNSAETKHVYRRALRDAYLQGCASKLAYNFIDIEVCDFMNNGALVNAVTSVLSEL